MGGALGSPPQAWPGAILLAYLAPCPILLGFPPPTGTSPPACSLPVWVWSPPLGNAVVQSIACLCCPGASVHTPVVAGVTWTFHNPAFVVGLPDRSFLFSLFFINSKGHCATVSNLVSKAETFALCASFFIPIDRDVLRPCPTAIQPVRQYARVCDSARLSPCSNTNLWLRISTRKRSVRRKPIFATRLYPVSPFYLRQHLPMRPSLAQLFVIDLDSLA